MTDAPSGYASGPPAAPHTNGGAIAALVCGIFSLTCCVPVAAAGLWLGIAARRSISRSDGTETGAGLALAGIILSGIGLALGLAFAALWILVRLFPATGTAPAGG